MSAALSPSNSFSARLTLAAGVLVMIEAPSMSALGEIVGKLEAANDTPAPTTGKPSGRAATAPAGQSASQTAASSAPAAAAPAAGNGAGNAASTSAPATAPAAASGSGAGDSGNGTQGGQAAAASPASSPKGDGEVAVAEVTFDQLKKAFLALSTKADGRAKCENVLKPFGLAKLSEAKPEQYGAVLAAIEEASK